jgi:hypothetical protein
MSIWVPESFHEMFFLLATTSVHLKIFSLRTELSLKLPISQISFCLLNNFYCCYLCVYYHSKFKIFYALLKSMKHEPSKGSLINMHLKLKFQCKLFNMFMLNKYWRWQCRPKYSPGSQKSLWTIVNYYFIEVKHRY